MNKRDLAREIAAQTHLHAKDVLLVIDSLFGNRKIQGLIPSTLKQGHRVSLVGFGVFNIKEYGPKIARNPRTQEIVKVPAKKAPYFHPSAKLKDKVNQGG